MDLIQSRENPLQPVLLRSQILELSDEQEYYVRKVLDLCCSDTQFSNKAYLALQYILKGGSTTIPVITSLVPSEATLGTPSFTLQVNGSGFGTSTIIVWNGSPEPTVFVSETQLTTTVNMDTAVVAVDIPVQVQTGLGVYSNIMTFSLIEAGMTVVSMGKTSKGRASVVEKHEEKKVSEAN